MDSSRVKRHSFQPRLLAIFALFALVYTWLLGHIRLSPLFPRLPWLIWTPFPESAGTIPYFSLCFFKNFTHLPCFLCGLTRSFVLIGRGQWPEAWHYYPLSIPLYGLTLAFVLLAFTRPIFAVRLVQSLTQRKALAILLSLLGACWIWKLSHNPAYW